jgi:hypothetical protein
MRVLFFPVGHSRNPVLVSDPGGPLGRSHNPMLVSDPLGPHSRNPVLVSDPLGPLAPFLLTLASSCRPPNVGEDVDVIQPQGVQASPALTGPIQNTFRQEIQSTHYHLNGKFWGKFHHDCKYYSPWLLRTASSFHRLPLSFDKGSTNVSLEL